MTSENQSGMNPKMILDYQHAWFNHSCKILNQTFCENCSIINKHFKH